MISASFLYVVRPELVLALMGLFAFLVAIVGGNRVARSVGFIVLAGFFFATITMFSSSRLEGLLNGVFPMQAFGGLFVDDAFARLSKVIVLVASACSILLSWHYFEKEGSSRSEYPVLVLFATLGMMAMISAGDFLSLYLGLELQSLSLYILAAFKRDDARSSEAGLKYFILGALSSGVLLYGVSLIYGFSGTTNFDVLANLFQSGSTVHPGVVVGLVFVCAAVAFKLSGVPFHMWAPDVYEGAPTPVTAFFASAPKLAALALLVRLLLGPFAGASVYWHQAVLFIAVASMLWGAFAGLVQFNLKRLLAYSAIANVGFLLVGVLAGGIDGVQALFIYFSIYALNILGAFAVVLCLRRKGKEVESLSDLAGLSRTNPLLALGMAVLMFSLAGIPPLAGFFGKYFIFLAAVHHGLVFLAVIGMLSSVVSAYYYLRIVKIMYFDEPLIRIDPMTDWGVRLVLGGAALVMVAFAFMPAPLVDYTLKVAHEFV
ncbi:MAG: NADH-quinone oxidoreductase subunit NuoN [Alphaproteobacteria bacterium]|nr:NADH-quinone oxidoreductase subunit NuoN [Alphaproteobacteria bacterium]